MEARGSSVQTHRIGKWLLHRAKTMRKRPSRPIITVYISCVWLSGIMCQMFSLLISETILMSKLWQELLHSLSAHQAWAHSQRGKTTQVSCFFCFYWERVIAISVSQACLFKLLPALVSRCLADGCSEAFVTNSSMKNHMARVHQQKEKPYQVQKSCFCF